MSALGGKADITVARIRFRGRYWGQSGRALVALHMSAYDPKRTWAVHRGNGFDAAFSPIKVLLSPYNVAS